MSQNWCAFYKKNQNIILTKLLSLAIGGVFLMEINKIILNKRKCKYRWFEYYTKYCNPCCAISSFYLFIMYSLQMENNTLWKGYTKTFHFLHHCYSFGGRACRMKHLATYSWENLIDYWIQFTLWVVVS